MSSPMITRMFGFLGACAPAGTGQVKATSAATTSAASLPLGPGLRRITLLPHRRCVTGTYRGWRARVTAPVRNRFVTELALLAAAELLHDREQRIGVWIRHRALDEDVRRGHLFTVVGVVQGRPHAHHRAVH